jgi:peptidase M13-like protein
VRRDTGMKTYLRWWTLHGNAPLLSKAFVEENFDFFGRTLKGSKKLLPRWRRCVFMADRDLGEALGRSAAPWASPWPDRTPAASGEDEKKVALRRLGGTPMSSRL